MSITTTTTTTTTTITFPQVWSTYTNLLTGYLLVVVSYIESVPGGAIIIRYIKSSHKNDPIRTLFEIALLVFAIKYFTTSKYEVKKKDFLKLTNAEIDELVDDWIPEPLVLPVESKEAWKLNAIPIVKGAIDTEVTLVDNPTVKLLDFASNNFLNFGVNELVKKRVSEVIRNNGVGACGPPNFYGTQDIHIQLEYDLARFFKTEGAILYGQDFCTAGSVLPSFVKRGDTIVADSACNLALQKAIQISRADVYWYNHNDMEDLEQLLISLHNDVFADEKPISRKFIITEGIFANIGDSPDLTKIVELKKKYKFRLFLDESLSLGVLGKTGCGLAEEYGIERKEIDITIGSMANAFCSSGAFCIGDNIMLFHQKIGSLAYCFSAALPPYVARGTSTAIQIIEDAIDSNGDSTIILSLRNKSKLLYNLFAKNRKISPFVEITSTEESPILHLHIEKNLRTKLGLPASYTGEGSEVAYRNKKGISDKFIESFNKEELLLQAIIDEAKEHGVLITRSSYSISQEILPLIPHLKICCNVDFTNKEIETAHQIVANSIIKHLKTL